MSIGDGWYLKVKHATDDKWIEVGPDPRRWGLFQFESSVNEMSELFKSLGLEIKIQKIQVAYDDR